jgi:transposase-like protein
VLIELKGSHFERDVILWGVRWYVAYPISYRQLEEMMQDRGVEVDHSMLNRWYSSMFHCWSRNFERASVQWVALQLVREREIPHRHSHDETISPLEA